MSQEWRCQCCLLVNSRKPLTVLFSTGDIAVFCQIMTMYLHGQPARHMYAVQTYCENMQLRVKHKHQIHYDQSCLHGRTLHQMFGTFHRDPALVSCHVSDMCHIVNEPSVPIHMPERPSDASLNN